MLNGRQETVEEQLSHFDEWGGRATYPHMSVGWAIAFDTPFAFTKQVASDFGGTRMEQSFTGLQVLRQKVNSKSVQSCD